MRPLCCDEFDDGLVRRSRPIALTHRYVQFNNDLFLNWLIFDIDRPNSFEYWETARLPPPNLYVQNPFNGHGHVFYALATPRWDLRQPSPQTHRVRRSGTAGHDAKAGR